MSAIALPEVKTAHDGTKSDNTVSSSIAAAAAVSSPIATNTPSVSKTISRSTNRISSDKVRLDVLLISGQRRFFDFDPQTNAKDVRETIWNEWPQDWPPRPMSSSAIRLLHLGHILEDKFVLSPGDSTAAARGIPVGKSTVVHLLLRQAPTKADGDEESLKKEIETAGCCSCVIC